MQGWGDESFVHEPRRRKARIRSGRASVAPKTKKKARKQDSPSFLANPEVSEHSEAERYTPPSSSIWRRWTAQVWKGRLPPSRIVSRGWAAAGGSNYALREVLVVLLRQYCFQEGIDEGDCPMMGVPDQARAAAASLASASSAT